MKYFFLAKGFTLIEVVVALLIVALTLSAGMRATGQLLHNSQRQEQTLLAQLCAQNALVALRLSSEYPGLGVHESPCQQASHLWKVRQETQATPNPNFRRVDVKVMDGESTLLGVTTIVGGNGL